MVRVMNKRNVLILITSVIALALLMAVFFVGSENDSEHTTITSIQKSENVEVECIYDKHQLYEAKKAACVQIECGHSSGSGIIWKVTPEDIVLLSNRHLLEADHIARVSFVTGICYDAEVYFLSENYDYGLAVIKRKQMEPEDAEGIEQATYEAIQSSEMRIGEPLYILTSAEYPGDMVLESSLAEVESFVEIEQLYTPQNMMLGMLNGEEEHHVAAGMSGSGVYNERGALVGILSGGDGKREYMMVPIWNLLTGL